MFSFKMNKVKQAKQEILGTFYDIKGVSYILARDNKTQTLTLDCSGRVQPWELPHTNLNLLDADTETVRMLIYDFIKTPYLIKECLPNLQFPTELLKELWHKEHFQNDTLKDAILIYQDIINEDDFITSLDYGQQWVLFTQNKYRTKPTMTRHYELFKQVAVYYLVEYLTEESISKYERVYGEWQTLLGKAVSEYYTGENKQEILELAKSKILLQKTVYKKELDGIRANLAELDKSYDLSSISEKIRMEDKIRGIVETEKGFLKDIADCDSMCERIERYLENYSQTILGFQE